MEQRQTSDAGDIDDNTDKLMTMTTMIIMVIITSTHRIGLAPLQLSLFLTLTPGSLLPEMKKTNNIDNNGRLLDRISGTHRLHTT